MTAPKRSKPMMLSSLLLEGECERRGWFCAQPFSPAANDIPQTSGVMAPDWGSVMPAEAHAGPS